MMIHGTTMDKLKFVQSRTNASLPNSRKTVFGQRDFLMNRANHGRRRLDFENFAPESSELEQVNRKSLPYLGSVEDDCSGGCSSGLLYWGHPEWAGLRDVRERLHQGGGQMIYVSRGGSYGN